MGITPGDSSEDVFGVSGDVWRFQGIFGGFRGSGDFMGCLRVSGEVWRVSEDVWRV